MVQSPLCLPGKVLLVFKNNKAEKILLFPHPPFPLERLLEIPKNPLEKNFYLQIKNYFEKKRKFLDFPVIIKGSEFEKMVWEEVRKIPYGSTKTYGELAQKLGSSPRTIAQALKRNPLPIYIPCHRVVAKNGLGGFSAGIVWKTFLLNLEK